MREQGTVVKPDKPALVVDVNGDMQMCRPQYGDDEAVPLSVMVMDGHDRFLDQDGGKRGVGT